MTAQQSDALAARHGWPKTPMLEFWTLVRSFSASCRAQTALENSRRSFASGVQGTDSSRVLSTRRKAQLKLVL